MATKRGPVGTTIHETITSIIDWWLNITTAGDPGGGRCSRPSICNVENPSFRFRGPQNTRPQANPASRLPVSRVATIDGKNEKTVNAANHSICAMLTGIHKRSLTSGGTQPL